MLPLHLQTNFVSSTSELSQPIIIPFYLLTKPKNTSLCKNTFRTTNLFPHIKHPNICQPVPHQRTSGLPINLLSNTKSANALVISEGRPFECGKGPLISSYLCALGANMGPPCTSIFMVRVSLGGYEVVRRKLPSLKRYVSCS